MRMARICGCLGEKRQGNRVKGSCCDEACEEVVVPGGDLAADAQGAFAGRPSDQVVGHVLEGGEVGGRVIGADAERVNDFETAGCRI